MQITAGQIAQMVNGEVSGDPDIAIFGPSKIEDAAPGTITFLANEKYKEYIYTTKASVVIVGNDFEPEKPLQPTLIKVDNVYVALAVLMQNFNSGITLRSGVAKTAVVDDSVVLDEGVSVDDLVIIKSGVKVGKNTKIYGQVFIGDNVTIGENVVIYPGVRIYHNCVIGNRCVIQANAVIGSDGFGFARDESGSYTKIPQTGNVILEDDVEVGSNTVIDRASLGSTLISKGAKLDNLIQIAHSVKVGKNTAIAAQTGVAGSTTIGENCLIGGQVGIIGHLKVADNTLIQAQSGVASNIRKPDTKVYGSPAIDYQNYLKSYANFKNLPDIVKEVRRLKLELEELKNQDKK